MLTNCISNRTFLCSSHAHAIQKTSPTHFQARLLKQIENDKLERAARAGKLPSQISPASAQSNSAETEATQSPRSSNTTRLCFRMPDGSSLKEQFTMKQT
jgi:hypothetical protein